VIHKITNYYAISVDTTVSDFLTRILGHHVSHIIHKLMTVAFLIFVW